MKHSKRSPGFSLILSLTLMAGIVMLVVTISAFVTVESRMAMNQQLATRARLNAVVSMRLALAHLQQEAGPDRRATARADITQPAATSTTVLNPMWTGVWRSDFPDLPPAWLISGRADQPAGTQSISLYHVSTTSLTPDYHAGYWAPWQTSYLPEAAQLVTLVGLGSATGQAGATPSGLVSLPKIALPDEVDGAYAYWIGDEGVKARPNITDSREKTDTNSADQLISVRSPVTHGLLKNLPNQSQLTAFTRLKEAPLLTGWDPIITGGGSLDTRKYFHDISLFSAGVLADPVNGGLKRDLSLAFELSDAQFAKTEFGGGATNAAGAATENGVEAALMPVLQDNGGRTAKATPIFSRTVRDGQLRGPTWWVLRDYHRLYKQLGWTAGGSGNRGTTTPSLNARTLWPNVAAAHPNGTPADSGLPNNSLRNRIYGYSDIYNGDLPTPINPNASDLLNGDAGKIITRPLNVAATPYVQRVSLAFGISQLKWTTVTKKGKTVTTTTSWDFDLRLTPTIVVHNPYNVQMVWQLPGSLTAGQGTPYAAAVSLSDIGNWKFRVRQASPGSTYTWETPIALFLKTMDPSSDSEDTLRFYLRDGVNSTIKLEPGEFRVFSCEPLVGNLSKSLVLGSPYDYRGGLSESVPSDVTLENIMNMDEPVYFEVIPNDTLRMRHALACWPGDQLNYTTNPGASDKDDFFLKSSEATETVFTGITREKYPSQGERCFQSWLAISPKYPRKDDNLWDGRVPYPTGAAPNPADLITVIDIETKCADSNAAPFPILSHSNPLAASARTSASGRLASGSDKGAKGQPASYQLSIRSGGTWGSTVSSDPTRNGTPVLSSFAGGTKAFGGNSVNVYGTPKCVLTEIPLTQPVSLAQYAHANFGTRDQQPLFSIGNSFASPLVEAANAIQDNGPNWTEFDQSHLLNAALWDGYFLSSLAPWMKTGASGAVAPTAPTPTNVNATATTDDPNESKKLSDVIADFVNKGTPLDNPRFSSEYCNLDATSTAKALADYRRSATVLTNKGAFNVNSTSILAWQTFLGSAKKFAIADKGPSYPDDANNGRFPRVLAKGTSSVANSNLDDASNWSGFANLTDYQITQLAQAIVDENKARFGLQRRTERDLAKPPGPRLFGGLTKPATPYLGLSEFINRFLTAETWANRCGALQAAIFRADQNYNAGLSDRLVAGTADRKLTQASLQTATAGYFPNPENILINPRDGASGVHTAMGAPGNLLQSDLLQSLGSALTTRSDTFTLRCFGEAAQSSGGTGSAWMEVVVQRLPEFIDPTNAPETGNSAPRPLKIAPSLETDASVSTALTKVNNVLGRRFKVISMRWLKADEI